MSTTSNGKITGYFKPVFTDKKNVISKSSAHNHPSIDKVCDTIIKQYESKLQLQAERRCKVLVMIEDIYYWSDHVYYASDTEKEDPKIRKRILRQLVDFLQSLPYVYISKHANQHLTRISEAQYMVDRDQWTGERFTVRPSSNELQQIFKEELRVCDVWVELRQFESAAHLLIALLLAHKECPDGFWRCYNELESLKILDHFGSLWQKTMHSDVMCMTKHKRDCLQRGFIRKYRMEIPMDIVGVISYYNQSVLDTRSKRVLYDLMAKESANLMEFGYDRGFEFGEIPDDIVNVDGHEKVTLDLSPNALLNDEELIALLIDEELEKGQKKNQKRKRSERKEVMRSAKKRKCCTVPSRFEWDALKFEDYQDVTRGELLEESQKHSLLCFGMKDEIAQRLFRHYQDFHIVNSD